MVDALPGAVGPAPPAPALKLAPVPRGIEKQLVQTPFTIAGIGIVLPACLTVVTTVGAPVETTAGWAAEIGTNGFSRPQGRKLVVNLECCVLTTAFSSV